MSSWGAREGYVNFHRLFLGRGRVGPHRAPTFEGKTPVGFRARHRWRPVRDRGWRQSIRACRGERGSASSLGPPRNRPDHPRKRCLPPLAGKSLTPPPRSREPKRDSAGSVRGLAPVSPDRLNEGNLAPRDPQSEFLGNRHLASAREAALPLDLTNLTRRWLDGVVPRRPHPPRARDLDGRVRVGGGTRDARGRALLGHDLDREPEGRERVDDPISIRRVPVTHSKADALRREPEERGAHDVRDALGTRCEARVDDLAVPDEGDAWLSAGVHANDELPPPVVASEDL